MSVSACGDDVLNGLADLNLFELSFQLITRTFTDLFAGNLYAFNDRAMCQDFHIDARFAPTMAATHWWKRSSGYGNFLSQSSLNATSSFILASCTNDVNVLPRFTLFQLRCTQYPRLQIQFQYLLFQYLSTTNFIVTARIVSNHEHEIFSISHRSLGL